MRRANRIISVIVMGIASMFYYLTLGFKKLESQEVGAAFMPRVYSIILILLGIILLIQSFKAKHENEPSTSSLKMVIFSMILIAIYIVATPILGFYISTMLIVLALLRAAKIRKPLIFIATPTLVSLFIYVFFQKLLHVPIPLGIFFS